MLDTVSKACKGGHMKKKLEKRKKKFVLETNNKVFPHVGGNQL